MTTCYHSINNLKGAAVSRTRRAANRQQPTIISFPQTEINLVNSALKIARFYISKNPQLFQQPDNILSEVENGINIISAKTTTKNQNSSSAATKGASSDINNNNSYRYQSLVNINKMLGLTNESIVNQQQNIKGASANNNSNNNTICYKKQSLKNIIETFSIYH